MKHLLIAIVIIILMTAVVVIISPETDSKKSIKIPYCESYDITRGNIHYIVVKGLNGYLDVINYTKDSLEILKLNKE